MWAHDDAPRIHGHQADGDHVDEQRSAEWQTFESLEHYWTGPKGPEFDPEITARMNRPDKIMLSASGAPATWAELRYP